MDKHIQIDSPGINKISFFKLFESLKELTKNEDEHISDYAKSLLEEVNQIPELREGFTDKAIFNKHESIIKKLTRLLFPDILTLNEIKALTGPFDPTPLIASKRYQNIMDNAGDDYSVQFFDIDKDLLYKFICLMILNTYYHYNVKLDKPFTLAIPNKLSNTTRYYRVAFNADLIAIEPTKKAIEITDNKYKELINNFEEISLWKKYFPKESWVFKGLGITNFIDVTIDHASASLTANLIKQKEGSFESIQEDIRAIFGNTNLEMGFAILGNQTLEHSTQTKFKSFLLHQSNSCSSQKALCGMCKDTLFHKKEAIAVPDVENFGESDNNLLQDNLLAQDIKSYIIIPLVHEDKIIAFLELASPKKYELHKGSTVVLMDILPTFAVAANKLKEERNNKIEALIQQECTTIHPSVKWRFTDQAQQYIANNEEGKASSFKDIIFRDVYPLYGQLDIKGSSTKRNEAVINDLNTQLTVVKKILQHAFGNQNLPMYEELIFRIDNYVNNLNDGLSAGSEFEVHRFINDEVLPIFDHLKNNDASTVLEIEQYEQLIDPELQVVYKARKAFDESVTEANHLMAALIDKKQEEAQKMFPHYFERYKTDGLEFNMYIGQSIVKDKTFEPMFLKNLRLWQLISMCEIELAFYEKEFQTNLEIASLVLLYSNPLSIHFRMDEKRFDVEGAYNARYEIVKKRVDKALIKGTQNRITVPGKIAIIYTNEHDRAEYMTYINYLSAKGLLIASSTDDFELDDLQGITGLKAIRVDINYQKSNTINNQLKAEDALKIIALEAS